MSLFHPLLDNQCSGPVLETPTIAGTQILDAEMQNVNLPTKVMRNQFLITLNVTVPMLQNILAVHVTMAQNVILRSVVRANYTLKNSWKSVLMTFGTPLCTLRQQSYLLLPPTKEDQKDHISYRINTILVGWHYMTYTV